jgi:hypothetical protein
VRTLAAAGVAITASLATALHGLTGAGVAAVTLFAISLGANVTSHATAQMDMRKRIQCLRTGQHDGLESNGWTTKTHVLNATAGLTLIAGTILLARFVAMTA